MKQLSDKINKNHDDNDHTTIFVQASLEEGSFLKEKRL